MIVNTATKDTLVWEEVNHQTLNRVENEVDKVLQCEIFFYKNNDISVRSTLKIQVKSNSELPYQLDLFSYTHISPDLLRVEFSETKHLAAYATWEEVEIGAQNYFNSHFHPKHHHHHHLHH